MLDFDEDDMISQNDLKMVIQRLAGKNSFSEEQMQHMIDNVSSFTNTSRCCRNVLMCMHVLQLVYKRKAVILLLCKSTV